MRMPPRSALEAALRPSLRAHQQAAPSEIKAAPVTRAMPAAGNTSTAEPNITRMANAGTASSVRPAPNSIAAVALKQPREARETAGFDGFHSSNAEKGLKGSVGGGRKT